MEGVGAVAPAGVGLWVTVRRQGPMRVCGGWGIADNEF